MNPIWIGLVGGALSFAHCLGMCGGFALHLSQGASSRTAAVRELLWHAGRTFTYVFLGAIAGFVGSVLTTSVAIPRVQDILAYAGGAVMALAGFSLLGIFPWAGRKSGDGKGGLLSSVVGRFFLDRTAKGAFAMGLATGFLPCPIVYGLLAFCATSGSVLTGMVAMASLGVGTAWSLLLLGMTGQMLSTRLRHWGARVGAIILILLGLATALRGTLAFHHLLGCPPRVSVAEGAHGPSAASQHSHPHDTGAGDR